MEIRVTTNEAAEFFNVSRATISDWQRAGAPKIDRGTWDLKALYDWREENILASAEVRSQLNREKLRRAKAQADLEELNVEERTGALISREEVVNEFVKRIYALKTDLLALPRRLTRWPEAKQIVDKALRQLMANYSKQTGILKDAKASK